MSGRWDGKVALVQRIEEQGGQALLVVDVSAEAQVRAMAVRTRATWGRVGILVNDAGMVHVGPIDGANTQDWREMVTNNLLGVMDATRAVLPLMTAHGGGQIVTISSVSGRSAREEG
jgi:NADP-dependent 3-hydroxy acid dehydrogenase YdfG